MLVKCTYIEHLPFIPPLHPYKINLQSNSTLAVIKALQQSHLVLENEHPVIAVDNHERLLDTMGDIHIECRGSSLKLLSPMDILKIIEGSHIMQCERGKFPEGSSRPRSSRVLLHLD